MSPGDVLFHNSEKTCLRETCFFTILKKHVRGRHIFSRIPEPCFFTICHSQRLNSGSHCGSHASQAGIKLRSAGIKLRSYQAGAPARRKAMCRMTRTRDACPRRNPPNRDCGCLGQRLRMPSTEGTHRRPQGAIRCCSSPQP